MNANILDVEQGSPAWFAARRGVVTASRVADAISKLKKGGETAARRHYRLEMLSEILTGKTTEHYVSAEMEFGIDNEPLARTAYELAKDVTVERVGFVLHPTINRAGASPDGLVGDDGLVEIKVPLTSTHLEYVLAGVVPEDYKPQMFWQMACCERKWCDFASFDPRLAEELQLFVVRLDRDDEVIAQMEADVTAFIVELNEMAIKLQGFAETPNIESQLSASIRKAKAKQWDGLGITTADISSIA